MSNKEKMSWCAGVVLLVLLYLLSSTDLIIKEKEKEICRISVIIDNVNDNYYGNFREGMETAEKKYQADVNFITLYAENDEEQQESLIVREVKDGTNAVILARCGRISRSCGWMRSLRAVRWSFSARP